MRIISLIFILTLFVGCSSEIEAVFPDKEWVYATDADAMGWQADNRDKLHRYLQNSTQITGLVLVHKGQIVFEYGNTQENSYIASCRKSILALLYGQHVQNGTIDLDKTLGEMGINDVTPLLDVEKTAKIRDLLAAKSGVFLSGSNGGDFRDFAPPRGSVAPGSYWLYSNWDFNTAGYIFENQTGKNIYDELERQLATPLDFQDWDRSLQRKVGDSTVSQFPAYHMWLSTRDMARIGLLMLNEGRWKNEQLIPEDWIREITTTRTTYADAQRNVPVLKEDGLDLGYGYMWWLVQNVNDPRMAGAYSAQGAIGQNITVYPAIETVLAFKTNSETGNRNSIQTQMAIMKNVVKIYSGDVRRLKTN
jgi:CubicO group peptidase (beta-lactamase class C family)